MCTRRLDIETSQSIDKDYEYMINTIKCFLCTYCRYEGHRIATFYETKSKYWSLCGMYAC